MGTLAKGRSHCNFRNILGKYKFQQATIATRSTQASGGGTSSTPTQLFRLSVLHFPCYLGIHFRKKKKRKAQGSRECNTRRKEAPTLGAGVPTLFRLEFWTRFPRNKDFPPLPPRALANFIFYYFLIVIIGFPNNKNRVESNGNTGAESTSQGASIVLKPMKAKWYYLLSKLVLVFKGQCKALRRVIKLYEFSHCSD